MVEDFTGGKITHRISRATESMFQSVTVMIFIFNSDADLRGGERVAPQFATPNPSRDRDFIWHISNFVLALLRVKKSRCQRSGADKGYLRNERLR